MCTLTLLRNSGCSIVTMNRDERRERDESGELVMVSAMVYPQDSVSGGTWIGMNEQGMAIAVLNRYQSQHFSNRSSRGSIIPEALAQASPVMWLSEFDPTPYNPFDLFCISKDQLWHFQWQGEDSESGYSMAELKMDDGFMFSSSSYETEAVLAYRRNLFRAWQAMAARSDEKPAISVLKHFHLRQDAGCARRAVLMEREWSHTKSIVQISLDDKHSSMDYYPDVLKQGASEENRRTALIEISG